MTYLDCDCRININPIMIDPEIIVANGTAIVLLLILCFSQFVTRRLAHIQDKVFNAFIFIGIVCAVLETLSFVIDGKEGTFMRVLNFAVNTSIYAGTATVSVLWLWYVELNLNKDVKKLKPLFFPFFIIWALLIAGLIGNIFGQYFFSVDAANVYHREPLGYIFYGFLMGSFVVSIVEYIRFRIRYGETQFFPIWMFLTPICAACVVQAVWYGISLAWLGCAVGCIGIYAMIQAKRAFVDSLTGLYNRAYIEHKLYSVKKSQSYVYSGIMIDVDYFKQINDTFGHSVGDKALKDVAKIILNVADRHCFACRFAGDEFVILVRLPSIKANELKQLTLDIEDRVRKEAVRFNETSGNPYKLEFSIGHSMYDISSEEDFFFHNMDSEMYKEKEIHHKQNKKQ